MLGARPVGHPGMGPGHCLAGPIGGSESGITVVEPLQLGDRPRVAQDRPGHPAQATAGWAEVYLSGQKNPYTGNPA